jgi:integrase
MRGLADGASATTINRSLEVVRTILNRAARSYRDGDGRPWLEGLPPMITMLPENPRSPYPITWQEQDALFRRLPPHLARMALFTINTGLRDSNVCGLQWEWEVQVPELATSVFIIPGANVKNGEERLVVLNRIAAAVVDAQRGNHPSRVFTYQGKPTTRMLNKACLRARNAARLPKVRVHDLKHTFGRRLRAAGVSLETRKVLLGHTTGDITSHYSAPELSELIEAANRVCAGHSGKTPALTLIKHKALR